MKTAREPELRAAPHIEAIPPTIPFIGPEELMREGGHGSLLRLGANESNFGPSPSAVAAMAAELPRVCRYGDPESYDLREALAARAGCEIENICVGAGIDDLMGLAVRAFVGPGTLALATRGTYPTFAYHVTGYGGGLSTVDYRANGSIAVEALIERACALHPAIVYLANPDNPSGTFVSRPHVEALLEAMPSQSLLLLDEAYAEFAPQDVLPAGIDPRLVRMRTFSKAYGMAGARIGYAISTRRTIETFQKIRLQYGVNRNAQIGALAALQDDGYMQGVVAEVARGRDEYVRLADSLGHKSIASHTNFVCIDFGSAARAEGVVRTLMQRGVFIRKPGMPPLDGYIRVTVGTPPERVAFATHLRAVSAA
ncbi:MAG: pyridoxal phosphate-dependent aminotransferase [Candidatus Meridianibacter frigidus]|nr:MAG: pyridoxal phosphate-dependent aminotransferase [Candidatus Eremiobacteraeota bacterium]